MDIDRYDDIRSSANLKLFSFVSKGPKGSLVKLVNFSPFGGIPNSYNIALGTIRGKNNVDYSETSDNNDRNKILSTIFHIARTFSREYPDYKIFVAGRNEATTRLYRGAINHEYDNIMQEFFVYGASYIENEDKYLLELFIPDKKYDAFLFERRLLRN